MADRAHVLEKQRQASQFCNPGSHDGISIRNEPSPERTGDMTQLPLRVSLNSALTKESNKKMENLDTGRAPLSLKSSLVSNSRQNTRQNSHGKPSEMLAFRQHLGARGEGSHVTSGKANGEEPKEYEVPK